MNLEIVELTSLNIDQVYPDSERTFPHPTPADIHDRRRAWIIEMLSKGLRHFSAFNEVGRKIALVEYMPIEESLDNIVGENVAMIRATTQSLLFRKLRNSPRKYIIQKSDKF